MAMEEKNEKINIVCEEKACRNYFFLRSVGSDRLADRILRFRKGQQ
jgi:hypothetical protein